MRYKEGVTVLDPQTEEELEAILKQMYPDNKIPVEDIYSWIGMHTTDYSVFVHDHGHRHFFTPKELSAYFWARSNYHAMEQDSY